MRKGDSVIAKSRTLVLESGTYLKLTSRGRNLYIYVQITLKSHNIYIAAQLRRGSTLRIRRWAIASIRFSSLLCRNSPLVYAPAPSSNQIHDLLSYTWLQLYLHMQFVSHGPFDWPAAPRKSLTSIRGRMSWCYLPGYHGHLTLGAPEQEISL